MKLKNIRIPGRKVQINFYSVEEAATDSQRNSAQKIKAVALFDTVDMMYLPKYIIEALSEQGLKAKKVGYTTYVKNVWAVYL